MAPHRRNIRAVCSLSYVCCRLQVIQQRCASRPYNMTLFTLSTCRFLIDKASYLSLRPYSLLNIPHRHREQKRCSNKPFSVFPSPVYVVVVLQFCRGVGLANGGKLPQKVERREQHLPLCNFFSHNHIPKVLGRGDAYVLCAIVNLCAASSSRRTALLAAQGGAACHSFDPVPHLRLPASATYTHRNRQLGIHM